MVILSAVSYTASSTNSAFSSTTPTGTGTNSASVSVGVNTGAARSATITYTQSGSGTKKTVSCSQAVGTQTRTVRDYSFSANPTSLSFDASGGTKSVTVTSQYRDGTQSSTDEGNNWSSTSWGNWQTASYTGTVDNTGGGAFSGSGNSVTAGANSSTSSRSGNLRLFQTRSGIQENGNSWPSPSNINVPLSQDGEAPKYRRISITLTLPPSAVAWKLTGSVLGIGSLEMYSIEFPRLSTSVDISDTIPDAISNIRINANFSYRVNGSGEADWRAGTASISPNSVSFSQGETGYKNFNVTGSI